MNTLQFSVLIPAAGASRRLGQAKQTLRHGAGTLVRNAIDTALACGPQEVIVVTGAGADETRAAARGAPVRWVHNARWQDGLGGSIARGAEAIGAGADAVLILLCDQWRIRPGDLQSLVSAWRSEPGRVAAAFADGRFTPPVMFPSGWFANLRALAGDRGAGGLLEANPGQVAAVPMENARYDLDTPADLALLREKSL